MVCHLSVRVIALSTWYYFQRVSDSLGITAWPLLVSRVVSYPMVSKLERFLRLRDDVERHLGVRAAAILLVRLKG